MKYESAWVKQRTDRTGNPYYGYLKYRDTNGKWKQTCKVLKTWTDANGDEKPVRGIRQAEKALAEWRQEMEAKSNVTSEKTYVSVYANAFLDALALKDDKRTIAKYRAVIKNHFGEFEKVPLGKLTHAQAQAWVLRLQSGIQAGNNRIHVPSAQNDVHSCREGGRPPPQPMRERGVAVATNL